MFKRGFITPFLIFIGMKKFCRIRDESKIFGVCSGVGGYTNTDPLIWRLIFFFSIFTPFPIITCYLLTTILTKIV